MFPRGNIPEACDRNFHSASSAQSRFRQYEIVRYDVCAVIGKRDFVICVEPSRIIRLQPCPQLQ